MIMITDSMVFFYPFPYLADTKEFSKYGVGLVSGLKIFFGGRVRQGSCTSALILKLTITFPPFRSRGQEAKGGRDTEKEVNMARRQEAS